MDMAYGYGQFSAIMNRLYDGQERKQLRELSQQMVYQTGDRVMDDTKCTDARSVRNADQEK